MNAIIYCRVSTDDQAENGISLDVQRDRALAYCAMRGFDAVKSYREEGVSGGKPFADRPMGALVMQDLKPGMALICQDMSRFSRNALDGMGLLEQWQRKNIAVHLIAEGGNALDLSTPSGWMHVWMMLGLGDYQRRDTGVRVKAAIAHKKARGESVGPAPYGYDSHDGKSTPNEAEQAQIAKMKHLRADEGFSFAGIADVLTGQRVATKQGGAWTRQQVQSILKREGVR